MKNAKHDKVLSRFNFVVVVEGISSIIQPRAQRWPVSTRPEVVQVL